MAVRASYITLRYFRKQNGFRFVTALRADGEQLVGFASMIEFQNNRISLSTIHARVRLFIILNDGLVAPIP